MCGNGGREGKAGWEGNFVTMGVAVSVGRLATDGGRFKAFAEHFFR